MFINKKLLCGYTLAPLLICFVAGDRLDDILISSSGIFGNDSPSCAAGAGSSTLFSSVYESTDDISDWADVNRPFEENAFEIDMTHIDTPEREWNIRIGKGGQIMSFIVKNGEAIPKQARSDSSWNDLVQQIVAAVSGQNSGQYPNFIHSGVYNTDEG